MLEEIYVIFADSLLGTTIQDGSMSKYINTQGWSLIYNSISPLKLSLWSLIKFTQGLYDYLIS